MKKITLKIMKILLIFSIIAFTGIIITFCIVTFNMDYTIPQITNVELYDNEGEKYLSYSNGKKQSYVKLEKISQNLIDAFIAIEDKRFYSHQGLDVIRIGGALLANLKSNGISEGASTITQQYVRTLFLTSEKTWKRKIREAMISVHFESKYSKDDILEGYLNAIYFDHGIYGVEDASIFYFNKHANELTIMEACCLASIPKGPTIYSPIKNSDKNKERRELVLAELLKDEKITQAEYDEALNEKLKLVGNNPKNDNTNSPYFQDLVIQELQKHPDILKVAYKGIKVYTTLDSDLYQTITNSIDKRIPETDIETAIYAMNPKTGEVLAVVGGRDYTKSSYNRAVHSLRQPGSSIKPFLYLTALENGFTPATTFKSEPTTFYYNNQPYAPTNFQSIYANMDVSMVYAIATSDNIYAMKTHLFLGPEKMSSTLKRFGFKGDIPNNLPSLALGTKEVTVQNLTEAYATLANLGTSVKPTIINKITTYDGEVLFEAKQEKTKVADESDVYLLNEAMTSIFDNSMTYNIRPTGAAIKSMLSHTYSGKSGSTDTDNWMVGYNPDILVTVWTGYDDNRVVTGLEDLRFGKYIWADVVEGYYRGRGGTWYNKPDDVISVDLNPMTGFYAGMDEYSKALYFRKSNIPWYIHLLQGQNPLFTSKSN